MDNQGIRMNHDTTPDLILALASLATFAYFVLTTLI
jgi:5-enolpyruvylshikimate-3-phosphate synthase